MMHLIELTATNAVVFQWKLVIFSERMAGPILGQENAAQVGMAGKPDAGEVIDLALMPIGGLPEAGNARYFGQLARLVVFPARQHDLQSEPMLVGEAG